MPRGAPTDAKVIFTHVPKVAGTSVMRRLVRPNYAPDEIRTFRGVRDLLSRRDAFRVLVGHSVYGMHHFTSGRCRYFTMLRNPVDRAISHYFFIKQPPLNPDFKGNAAQQVLHQRVALKDIFDQTASKKRHCMGTWLVDNMQTRYVAGYAHYWKPADSPSLLAAAKRNLRERYAVFGLQNEFQESLSRISDAFGWDIGAENARRAKQTRIEKTMDDEDRAAVERWNQLDMELFDFAQELFRQKALV